MGKLKNILIILDDDFNLTKKNRQEHNELLKVQHNMVPLSYDKKLITIKPLAGSILYVEGDTTTVDFWRAIRNATIEDVDCNDDYQFDDGVFNLQKTLLEHNIIGKIKIALIAKDTSPEELKIIGQTAIDRGYVPLYWCGCHDHFSVNDHVQKALENPEPDFSEWKFIIPSC